ncbi:MAG: hypothetical protein NTY64_03935 [Deltaproteobacteria bacterium]|nr:hypothetical protein [Deltaproteobacteria bacterium]
MDVKIHPHAYERMIERGATETEVIAAVPEASNFLRNMGESVSEEISLSLTSGEDGPTPQIGYLSFG